MTIHFRRTSIGVVSIGIALVANSAASELIFDTGTPVGPISSGYSFSEVQVRGYFELSAPKRITSVDVYLTPNPGQQPTNGLLKVGLLAGNGTLINTSEYYGVNVTPDASGRANWYSLNNLNWSLPSGTYGILLSGASNGYRGTNAFGRYVDPATGLNFGFENPLKSYGLYNGYSNYLHDSELGQSSMFGVRIHGDSSPLTVRLAFDEEAHVSLEKVDGFLWDTWNLNFNSTTMPQRFSASQKQAIANELQANFLSFGLPVVVTTDPTSVANVNVFIGRRPEGFEALSGLAFDVRNAAKPENRRGVDRFDQRKDGSVIVWVDDLALSQTREIAIVAAHEAGHAFGLPHVDSYCNLMVAIRDDCSSVHINPPYSLVNTHVHSQSETSLTHDQSYYFRRFVFDQPEAIVPGVAGQWEDPAISLGSSVLVSIGNSTGMLLNSVVLRDKGQDWVGGLADTPDDLVVTTLETSLLPGDFIDFSTEANGEFEVFSFIETDEGRKVISFFGIAGALQEGQDVLYGTIRQYSADGSFVDIDSFQFTVVANPVPEPSALLMLAVGLCNILLLRRRRPS